MTDAELLELRLAEVAQFKPPSTHEKLQFLKNNPWLAELEEDILEHLIMNLTSTKIGEA